MVNDEIQEVVTRVAGWPAHDRILLARKILESVEQAPVEARRGYTAKEVIGLLNIPQPAPGDEECLDILERELMRKHGG